MKWLLRNIRLFSVIVIALFMAGCTMGVPVIPDLPEQASATADDNRGGPPPDRGPPVVTENGNGNGNGGPPPDRCNRGNSSGGGSCSGLLDKTNPHFDEGNPWDREGDNPGFGGRGNPHRT